MYCAHCGAQIPDTASFCPRCGSPTAAGARARAAASTDAQAAGGPAMPQQPSGPTMPQQPGPTPVAPPPAPVYGMPISTDRSLFVWAALTIVTCGIYQWFFICQLAQDMNTMCEGDGDETPGLLTFILLSVVTCGLYSYWWEYKIGNRLQRNAPRYGLAFQENGTTIILWQIVGVVLCCLGPFIAMNIVIKNTNALAAAYNARIVR